MLIVEKFHYRRKRLLMRWLLCLIIFAGLFCSACREQNETQSDLSGNSSATPLETVRALAAQNRNAAFSRFADVDQYPPEIQRIVERGEIVFGMTAADQKPFFYKDESSGELIGLDVEIAYGIANTLGVRAVFNREASSFDAVVLNVANKKVDVALSKLSRTLRRASLVRFTRPYITFRQALLVNRLELAKVSSEENLPLYIKQLRGSIAIIRNSSYIGYAETNFPLAEIKTYDSWNECIEALFAGEVLAAYRDEGEILIINETRADSSILMKPVFINDKQDPIAMAVAYDAPLLAEWLDLFLEDYILQHKADLIPAQLIRRHYKQEGNQ
jgi:ABC-type amino acid transport substrate-binding protein